MTIRMRCTGHHHHGADDSRHLQCQKLATTEMSNRNRTTEILMRRILLLTISVMLIGTTVTRSAHAETWQELLAKADSLRGAAQFDSALVLAQRALEITEREYGGEDTATASVARAIGCTYLEQANFGEAERYLKRALSVREHAFGPEKQETAVCLRDLGILSESQERWPEAEDYYRRALAIFETSEGPNGKVSAYCLTDIGLLYVRQSRYAEAEPLLRRALQIKEQLLGPEHRSVATAASGLAAVYLYLGRFTEAETMYERALAIAERSSDSAGVSTYAHNLGRLWAYQGRYAEAELMLRRALRIRETVYGPGHPKVAETLQALGVVLSGQNREDELESVCRRALAITENALGPHHSMVAASLTNLGSCLMERGRFVEAEPVLQRALEITAESLGRENWQYAFCLGNLAGLYSEQQRYADAVRLRRQELVILTNALGPDHAFVGDCMSDIAVLCSRTGRLQEADSLFEQALSIFQKAVGENSPDIADISYELALNAEQEGRQMAAVSLSSRAWRIYTTNFRDGATALSERDALLYSSKQTGATDHYLSLLLSSARDGVDSDEIARVVLTSKEQVTDGLLARLRQQAQVSDPEVMALVDSLKWARYALSKLYVDGPDPEHGDLFRDNLRKRALEKERLEAELARRSSSFTAEQDLWDVDAQKIAQALPPGAALVEFMWYVHHAGPKDGDKQPRYLAAVMGSGGGLSVFPLGSAAAIDTAVRNYRQQFRDPRNLDRGAYAQAAESLYALVWRPFATLLSGASTVFIAPDGNLNLVSFAGLMDDEGKYLTEQYPMHYLSTGRDLIRLQDEPQSGTGLLAMGDPDFDKSYGTSTASAVGLALLTGLNLRSSCEELDKLHVASLPGTRTEVNAVSNQWKRSRADLVVTHFGSDATEEQFKRDAPGKRVIHLATHGFYISDECQKKLSTRGELAIQEGGYVGENPLLLSGLLLAGANKHGEGAKEAKREDGIVTGEEVAGMNLRGTDLVVLSACETGLGTVKSGEGVYGLRRAFQMAGARTVISALWPIDDKSTAEFMGQLFSAQNEDLPHVMQRIALSRISALRSQGKSDHPFFWAAFVATGDWKTH
jgi:CHAT domain-containing protein/tetratricopeptide (TPR) repeat protein